ncbi:MAG: hypothetical protein OIF58_15500, partial [Cohaesibacter sp.]|nr:hypothetical protein [Cohaesibacter sp.]
MLTDLKQPGINILVFRTFKCFRSLQFDAYIHSADVCGLHWTSRQQLGGQICEVLDLCASAAVC